MVMNMKKMIKKVSLLLVALIIICASMITASADTIYYDNGLLYTYLNNDEITICGAAEGVTTVKIPYYINYRYVVDIRNRAFLDNTEITTVDFSNIAFLRRIGSFAFAGCTNLSGEVVIPNTVTTFDTAAFQGCTSLDSVVIDAQVEKVPNQGFQGCTNLSNVTLNENITEIGYYAFAGCTNLKELVIPSTVTTIADSAFDNDEEITLGVYYGSAAYTYAKGKGIAYTILDPENIPTEPKEVTFILGDADGDGSISILDATKIQRVLASIDPDDDGMITLRGNVNEEKELNILHATKIQRFIAGYEVAEPIGTEVTRTIQVPVE